MKTPNKITSIRAFGAVSTLLFSASIANAELIASEDFAYAGGTSLTTTTINNGAGWADAWQNIKGVSGFVVSGSDKSLHLDQSPQLVADGSSHIAANTNRGNERYFQTSFSPAFYSTLLLTASRTQGQMRMEFYSGAQMRANVGIDQGALYASSTSVGYTPTRSESLEDAFAANTTYLLAIKRGGNDISAALVEVDGDMSRLDFEPTWQVVHSGVTGVAFDRLRLIAAGATWRLDELRVASSWAEALPTFGSQEKTPWPGSTN